MTGTSTDTSKVSSCKFWLLKCPHCGGGENKWGYCVSPDVAPGTGLGWCVGDPEDCDEYEEKVEEAEVSEPA